MQAALPPDPRGFSPRLPVVLRDPDIQHPVDPVCRPGELTRHPSRPGPEKPQWAAVGAGS